MPLLTRPTLQVAPKSDGRGGGSGPILPAGTSLEVVTGPQAFYLRQPAGGTGTLHYTLRVMPP